MRHSAAIRFIALTLLVPISVTCGGGGKRRGSPTTPGATVSVSGDVISGGTGGGLGGMQVSVVSGPDAGRSTTTEADGRYTLDGLAGYGFTLRVQGPRYEPWEETVSGAIRDFTMMRRACQNARCGDTMSGCNEPLPMFNQPFEGTFPVSAGFDHSTPIFEAPDGSFISFCGGDGSYDGHSGWDFPMPVGTALLAAGEGVVVFAGKEDPFYCRFLGKEVAGKAVVLRHISPHGERILSAYGHLSTITVDEGQSIGEGDQIGLSGNTGCSTGPHLHFAVLRQIPGPNNPGLDSAFPADPFGWQGVGHDPWAESAQGAISAWMWKDRVPATFRSLGVIRDEQNIPFERFLREPLIR